MKYELFAQNYSVFTLTTARKNVKVFLYNLKYFPIYIHIVKQVIYSSAPALSDFADRRVLTAMKLSRGNKGIPYTIEKINLDSDTVVRLMTIGMTHGAKIRILSKKKSGSVIILLRTTRFALGAALAEGIEIKECDHG